MGARPSGLAITQSGVLAVAAVGGDLAAPKVAARLRSWWRHSRHQLLGNCHILAPSAGFSRSAIRRLGLIIPVAEGFRRDY